MAGNGAQTRSPWWALAGGVVVLVAAFAGRAQINPWLFGVLLLIAWALLAYGLSSLRVATPLRLLLVVSVLAVAVVLWDYTAQQPHLQLDGVRVPRLPSTVSSGVVELVVRNGGSLPADVVGTAAAQLTPLFKTPGDLAAGNMEGELSERLKQADEAPALKNTVIPPGETARVQVDIPSSQRSWYLASGQATVVMTARFRYRDRVFHREQMFCLFANPPSGKWLSCPFLNR
jgi:hypothetical protein